MLPIRRGRWREGGWERQPDSGHGLRRDALAPAGKAEPVGRRRLDADACRGDAENSRNPLDHDRPVRTDLRPLAYDRHVDRGKRTTMGAHEISGMP